MIYELAREIETHLRAAGVPFPVVYGPEPKTSTVINRNRIVIERVRESGADAETQPRSQQRNPGILAVRPVAVRVAIFAQSTLSGADVHDHERLADAAADAFDAALYTAVKARRTLYTLPAWGLLGAADLQMLEIEQWHGVVYGARFSIDRGVPLALSWTEPARPEATIGGEDGVTFKSTTRATVNGYGTPETACGATET